MSTAPHTRVRTAACRAAPNIGHGISGSENGGPAAANRGGVSPSTVARLPQNDVGSAVLGWVFELDEAATQPVRAELRLMRCTA
jgi:hypothetical protein